MLSRAIQLDGGRYISARRPGYTLSLPCALAGCRGALPEALTEDTLKILCPSYRGKGLTIVHGY